ncbi:MAG: hypothetical protein AB1568_02640 [Thermodesulfobacteriota bacterium]
MTVAALWHGLLWPLLRLLFAVSLGILIGNFIESLNWTHHVAKLARPLVRLGRMSDVTGASFSVAFFSGVTSNTILAEAYDQKRLSRRELVLANLFNSLPRYFLHLPTVFFLTAPLVGAAAFYYVGITLTAAALQTLVVVLLGRLLLAARDESLAPPAVPGGGATLRQALDRSVQRFRKRIGRIVRYTVPVYTLFYFLNHYRFFDGAERFLADHLGFLSWLKPQSLGIVALHVTAEFAAGLAAAGALLDAASLSVRDVVLALMVGNILSTPMRAIRHQFPYYAGIFPPALAVELIFCSQALRVVTVLAGTVLYYHWSM